MNITVRATRRTAGPRTFRGSGVFKRSGGRMVKKLCAVQRRASSAGANPARQLSFQPVAVGAAMEVTKSSEPLMQRVASGDLASRWRRHVCKPPRHFSTLPNEGY
jgi:hypothetical protein